MAKEGNDEIVRVGTQDRQRPVGETVRFGARAEDTIRGTKDEPDEVTLKDDEIKDDDDGTGVTVTDKDRLKDDAVREDDEDQEADSRQDQVAGARETGKGKPFKRTRDGRINHYRKQAGEYQTAAEKLAAENDALKRGKAISDYAAMVHYTERLKGQKQNLIDQHQAAGDQGDTKKQAEIAGQMAQVASQLTEADTWLAQNPNPVKQQLKQTERQQQRPAAEQQRPQQVQYDEPTQDWLDANPYMNQEADEFDPDMAAEAKRFAAGLEARYTRRGEKDKIASQDYFDAIDEHMREEFPEAFGDDGDQDGTQRPAARQQQRPAVRRSPVAPAGRGAPRRDQGGNDGNTIRLTSEQKEMALSLPLKHPNGKNFTPQEKIKQYAINMRKGA